MAAIDVIKSRAEETMTTILSHRMAGPLGKAMHVTAQCAFWVVRWPSSQKLKSKNTLSDVKKIFLRPFFLCCFRKKTLKLVSLFIFRH